MEDFEIEDQINEELIDVDLPPDHSEPGANPFGRIDIRHTFIISTTGSHFIEWWNSITDTAPNFISEPNAKGIAIKLTLPKRRKYGNGALLEIGGKGVRASEQQGSREILYAG